MAVLCGWASNGETGRASGGKAGDQTGREVKTGNWYDFGQTEVFRWKDRNDAVKYASIIKYWCNGDYVGYDQDDRTTLGSWCKKHKWSYKVDVKVETDCSRMVADGINCTMGKEIIKISETFYTGNLGEKLMKTGLFVKLTGEKYCDEDDYLKVGDIINNPSKHVITALANGSKVKTTTKKTVAVIAQEVIEGKWGNGSTRTKKLQEAGYKPSDVQKKVNAILRTRPKTSVNEIAKDVANGLYGNGVARVKLLKSAGYSLNEIRAIQKKVNQMVK